jgi:hypothetical protein
LGSEFSHKRYDITILQLPPSHRTLVVLSITARNLIRPPRGLRSAPAFSECRHGEVYSRVMAASASRKSKGYRPLICPASLPAKTQLRPRSHSHQATTPSRAAIDTPSHGLKHGTRLRNGRRPMRRVTMDYSQVRGQSKWDGG